MRTWQKTLVMALLLVLVLSAVPVLAKEYDFGGKTVTFIGWIDNLEEARDEGRVAEAEELFNVKIENMLADQEEYQEILTARLISGDSEYDVWRMASQPPWFLSLAAQDSLLAINDIVDDEEYYAEALEVAEAAIDVFSLGDKRYALAEFPSFVDAGASFFTLFNKDIIEDAGLPDLYDEYFADNWTWDLMREVALATTIDFDGDGEIDQWGIANMYVWAFLTISNGDNIYVLDEDGRYKYNWTSERILEGLEFGAKLRNEDQVLVAGIEAFEQGNAALGFAEGWRIEGFAKGDHDVNYGVLPLPRGPQGKNTLYTGWFETFVLPSNVAQPEAMLALVDFLLRDPDIVATTEGMVEKRVNEWAPDAKGARVLSEVLTNYAKEGEYLAWTLASAEVIEEGYNKVMLGEKTAAEAMSAVAAAGQAYVDELLGYD